MGYSSDRTSDYLVVKYSSVSYDQIYDVKEIHVYLYVGKYM